MHAVKDIVCLKKVNFKKLLAFGFEIYGDAYTYTALLPESGFLMHVKISEQGEVFAEVLDPTTDEPYTLHLLENASGSFVGGIRQDYKNVLSHIAENCFDVDVFKSSQTCELIEFVRKTYNDELEFLWKKSPSNAVWRRKDTKKWYGAVLTVSRKKLGFQLEETVEVVDLRIAPEELKELVDGKKYFPGYHMNKKRWLTIVLDGSVSTDEICTRIDKSYSLAVK